MVAARFAAPRTGLVFVGCGSGSPSKSRVRRVSAEDAAAADATRPSRAYRSGTALSPSASTSQSFLGSCDQGHKHPIGPGLGYATGRTSQNLLTIAPADYDEPLNAHEVDHVCRDVREKGAGMLTAAAKLHRSCDLGDAEGSRGPIPGEGRRAATRRTVIRNVCADTGT
jgi:hypothetical protein